MNVLSAEEEDIVNLSGMLTESDVLLDHCQGCSATEGHSPDPRLCKHYYEFLCEAGKHEDPSELVLAGLEMLMNWESGCPVGATLLGSVVAGLAESFVQRFPQ
eukprot:5260374-Amphidinium_carterae.1